MAIATPEGYRPLDDRSVPDYLAGLPAIRQRLGGEPGSWRVREVGDGNLNLVFIVEGPAGDLCLKQALPYVRLVGEGWPLDLRRAWYEHRAASIQSRHAGARIPELLHFDERLYLIVMECCRPHVIMRRGMLEAVVYPEFAAHIAEYLATTLYYTSDLALPAAEKRELVAAFSGNTELCKITEDLIFTDPYMVCSRNRWTSPQLDDVAAEIRGDARLKRAVSALKLKFLSEAQALLHGDLHTGSIMVTAEDTKVIDPEFAVMGPMGFDVGKLLGNLLLSHFSQRGHERAAGDRDGYRRWILATVAEVWTGFRHRFVELWTAYPTGDGYPAPPVRRHAGPCLAARGAGGLHGPPVPRCPGVRGCRHDPPHAGPRPQHRPGADRGPRSACRLRAPHAQARARACHRPRPVRRHRGRDRARRGDRGRLAQAAATLRAVAQTGSSSRASPMR